MFAANYCYVDKTNGGTIGMQEKRISPLPPGLPSLGLTSAFSVLPPNPLAVNQLHSENRYLWDQIDHTARLHALQRPTALPGLASLGNSPLELLRPLAPQPGELTAPHATYRVPNYMEHFFYPTLHPPPQPPLRGLSPLSPLQRSALNAEYIGMSGLAATRISDQHLLPTSLTSADLTFSLDGSRLASPRPCLRQSRKRALSSSPYSDSFDINSMIRFSPNSLVSIMNGSRSSSGSGSYGHLSAGAISPALGVPATTQLQQLQAQLIRGASVPGSPFLAPSPLLPHSAATLAPPQNIFALTSQPQPLHYYPIKPQPEKKDCGTITTIFEEDKKATAVKKEQHSVTTPALSATATRNGLTAVPTLVASDQNHHAVPTANADDDIMKEEPDDFIETNCNWTDCIKEFSTQDELVKHINNDHIHANKKSFICRWKECSREEKPFKAQYMLVVHMRRHTGEKPHRCTFEGCPKAYSRLENLKTHLRSHTGEKPYMCEHTGCTKAFSNASDRAKHQNRTHSNEKPYVCKADGCTKRYTDPSSLRKHVKTVHGADFYASKKHKGNDHPHNNPGHHNNSRKDPNGNSEGSPNSEGVKGSSLSSPSIKSEEPTSPGQEHSPAMIVGGGTPMDQSRLLDYQINENGIPTSYEVPFPEELEVEDDIDASIDIPIGMGSVSGGSVLTGIASAQDINRINRLKLRLQSKGLTSVLPNTLGPPLRRASGNGVGELSQKINQMKVNSGQTSLDGRGKNINEFQFRPGQTMLPTTRRDSTSTVSTYYGSMRSDSSHQLSRRGSEMSQTSYNSVGRQAMNPSPYDPISCGSSRRSSETSTYNMMSATNSIATQLSRFNRHGMTTPEVYNTSNLVVQTQNMSLSQENINAQNWQTMTPVTPTIDPSNNGYFGAAGPLGPPTSNHREATRRSSDPVRPIDRGFEDSNSRVQRFNSYYNCNYRGQIGMRPLMTPPIYPNQNPVDQQTVNMDMKMENKDRSTYGMQPIPASPYPQPENVTGPYQGQLHGNPYPTHPMMSPNNYQYPQQPTAYPIALSAPPVGYNQTRASPNPMQFNSIANSAAHPCTPGPNAYQKAAHMNNGYPVPQQPTGQMMPNGQQFCPQYSPFNGQYMRQFSATPQNNYGYVNNQQRFNSNAPNTPSYPLGATNFGPVHICGHLAAPNLPSSAYQLPCAACQSRGYANFDQQAYPQTPNSWHVNNGNVAYPSQYCSQVAETVPGTTLPYQDTIAINHFSAVAENGAIGLPFPEGGLSDVQCQDVSQSTQNLADNNGAKIIPRETAPQLPVPVVAPPPVTKLPEATKPVDVSPPSEKPKEDPKKMDAVGAPAKDDTNNNFMKPDAYQRTLEYVQQCESWSTNVKEEVSSTTDQKPKLNADGAVVGYIPARNNGTLVANNGTILPNNGVIVPHNGVIVPQNGTVVPFFQPPIQPVASSVASLHTPTFGNTPLPATVLETPNMVINDMNSSLSCFQKENKYLQLLQ